MIKSEPLLFYYTEKWEQLQYPFTRKRIPNTLHDIHDGKLYQELQNPGGFLSYPENTGLVLCTDGVQLSSNQSFWPVLLALTSLPPGVRMNAENLVLAGVWQCSVKPPMDIILGPVLDKISIIHIDGISVLIPGFSNQKIVRVQLLLSVFDLPARAMATNFVQYNGNYSCIYCCDKGEHVAYRQLLLPDEDHEPRTKESITRNAKEAEQSGKPVFGVKCESILSSHLNIVQAVTAHVDYMHAVLEGISKRLLSTILDSKNHAYRYYLGTVTNVIDEKMRSIKPPEEFRRSPRSVTTIKQWKASEFRAWILYYCIPVLNGILPADYIYHLSLLVSAMHILLGDAIPLADIDTAQELLQRFYTLTLQLYSRSICTANMHLLIHLSECVRNWGPLWSYSCFGFESMNGHLRKSCHGTRNVLPQLVHNVRIRQMLITKGKQIAGHADPNVAAFISSLADIQERTNEVEIKSRITHKRLDQKVVNALKSANIIDPTSTDLLSQSVDVFDTILPVMLLPLNHRDVVMDQYVFSATILDYILGLLLNSAFAMEDYLLSLINLNLLIKLSLITFALPPLVN